MKGIAVLVFFFITFQMYSQTLETVGSGVIDFLTSNPTTANRMNDTQFEGLRVIGDLLEIAGQRKHEMNVANAGRYELVLQDNSGRQATVVYDINGNIFILLNGIVYPINQNLVSEAKEYVLNQQDGYMEYVNQKNSNGSLQESNVILLPDYNISIMRDNWDKKANAELEPLYVKHNNYFNDILSKYDADANQLYVYYPKGQWNPIINLSIFDKYYNNKKPFAIGEEYRAKVIAGVRLGRYVYFNKIITHLKGVFSASWITDVNSDGSYQFDEIQDIRRNFYENESFVILGGISTQYYVTFKINIYEQITGKVVYSNSIKSNGHRYGHVWFNFSANQFPPSIYTYNVSFLREKTNEEIASASDKFQILPLPSNNTSNKESSSSEETIKDLLRLLKDGKISEETYRMSIEALQNEKK